MLPVFHRFPHICVVPCKWLIKGRSHLNNPLFIPHETTSHSAAQWHMSRSSIVCPLHCPQGSLLTRQGNTWSLLCFKWLTLRLHSPRGMRLSHFVPCFPTEPQRSTFCPAWNIGNQTLLSSQSRLTGSEHAGRSAFSSHVCRRVYLKGPRQVQACPLSTVDAARVAAAAQVV